MRNEGHSDIGLVLWFVRQRIVESALMAATVGACYIYQYYFSPLVPPGEQPSLRSDILARYVIPCAETVFAVFVMIQILIIMWITALPPRQRQRPLWWI